MLTPSQFQRALLKWFDAHGRKTLPWQHNKTPYRVWISEIMLQQTQVSTVIPYFEKFMQCFPDLTSLANADVDSVLHQWAGLGYYSRARNLHRAAQMVVQDFGGQFPDNLNDLQTLPGIGRSTAGAILSIAFQQRATILDGNVKRVLARYLGVMEPVNEKAVEKVLWEEADQLTPTKRSADYTQAIMDLGATLCTRSQPDCAHCPLVSACRAQAEGMAELLPVKKASRAIPARDATFVIVKHGNHILLEKRPPHGIWGGLWSLPELSGIADKKALRAWCQQHRLEGKQFTALPAFRHTFSHYHLDIHPIVVTAPPAAKIMECDQQIWYNLDQPAAIGLPKPIQTILRSLA